MCKEVKEPGVLNPRVSISCDLSQGSCKETGKLFSYGPRLNTIFGIIANVYKALSMY